MAGLAPEGSQFDARQYDSKMNELLQADGQEFFTSYDEQENEGAILVSPNFNVDSQGLRRGRRPLQTPEVLKVGLAKIRKFPTLPDFRPEIFPTRVVGIFPDPLRIGKGIGNIGYTRRDSRPTRKY